MTDLERYYKESIISSYSDISFARLSNPGELIDRSFSLQDIFSRQDYRNRKNTKIINFKQKGNMLKESTKKKFMRRMKD